MKKQKILKAEVLITRRCNLKCKSCKVINKAIPQSNELSLKLWNKTFNIIYDDLGADFIAIYGGEPMILGKEKLGIIVKNLSKHRPEKSYTIISNSIGLTDEYQNYLIEQGLDSWTASVDTLNPNDGNDKYSKAKSKTGLDALLRFQKKNLRDVCGIITVTKKNIKEVPDTVKFLTDLNIWCGLDLIHYDKTGYDNFSTKRESMLDLVFEHNDLPLISETADKLIQLKKEGALIFPTFETLENWKDSRYSIDLNWKCGEPKAICVDANGEVYSCDQFQGSRLKHYTIFDLPKKWEQFKKDYIEDVRNECLGCFWSTHTMLYEKKFKEGNGKAYYQHESKKL